MSLMERALISGPADFNLSFVNANGVYFRMQWEIIRLSDRFDRASRLYNVTVLLIVERPFIEIVLLYVTNA